MGAYRQCSNEVANHVRVAECPEGGPGGLQLPGVLVQPRPLCQQSREHRKRLPLLQKVQKEADLGGGGGGETLEDGMNFNESDGQKCIQKGCPGQKKDPFHCNMMPRTFLQEMS